MGSIGQRHLVQCRCILHQLKSQPNPPRHQFVVFSVIDADGSVLPKTVRCNNCGILHRVTDLCKSDILNGREDSRVIVTIDDVKQGMDKKLVAYLETSDVDIATWEHVKHIITNEQWGSHVVISTEKSDGFREGKYLRIYSPSIFTVETFSEENDVRQN